MRVFGTQVVKGWACDKNVVGIFQGVATEAAEGGPIAKPGGSGSAGRELRRTSIQLYYSRIGGGCAYVGMCRGGVGIVKEGG